ncbi:MAG TPA: M12 family metallo-peptidase [Steroidobacteraceae bacterium]
MFNRKLCTGGAVLACLALFRIATAAPAFKILYHERLEIVPRVDAQGQQHVSFDAYGRHFDVDLESNENIRRGVSANRSDIRPYRGAVAGQAGSWVRLTHTRDGWRGVIFDGHELYAIEAEDEVRSAMSSSTGSSLSSGGASSSSAPVMYRLADTLMPYNTAYGGTAEESDSITPDPGGTQGTALNAYSSITKDISNKDTSTATTKQLVVGVVVDHEFTDSVGSDPEGAIVARMDIVDGIWSSQVGIQIVLGPVRVLPDATDTFSATTVPANLLAEVATYRGKLPSSDGSGLTHLMTGRALDGNIIGISYQGAVCDGKSSASLSQSTASTMEGALVAAHEIGHNFSAVHDGVTGACSSTPQTYLMAPTINFSNQFSACSLGLINTLVKTASCLETVAASSGSTSTDTGSGTTTSGGGISGSGTSSGTTSSGAGDTVTAPTAGGPSSTSSTGSSGGGSIDLVWLAFLATLLMLQLARAPLQRRRRL